MVHYTGISHNAQGQAITERAYHKLKNQFIKLTQGSLPPNIQLNLVLFTFSMVNVSTKQGQPPPPPLSVTGDITYTSCPGPMEGSTWWVLQGTRPLTNCWEEVFLCFITGSTFPCLGASCNVWHGTSSQKDGVSVDHRGKEKTTQTSRTWDHITWNGIHALINIAQLSCRTSKFLLVILMDVFTPLNNNISAITLLPTVCSGSFMSGKHTRKGIK